MSSKFENEQEAHENKNLPATHEDNHEEKVNAVTSGRSHSGFILFDEERKESEVQNSNLEDKVAVLQRNSESQSKDPGNQAENSNRSTVRRSEGQPGDIENSSRNAEFGSYRDGQQMFSDRNNPQANNNENQTENQQGHFESQVETRIIDRNLESHINSLTEVEIKVGRGVAYNSLSINMKAIVVLLVFYLYFELRLKKDVIFLTFAIINVIGFMNDLYVHRKSVLIEKIIFKFIENTAFFLMIVGIYMHAKFDISKLVYSINIYPLISVCYWYKLHSPDNKKHFPLYFIFRMYVYIQALHIALKVDNIIDWNWASIFWITWILLTTLLFYVVGLLVLALLTLYYTIVGDAEKFQLKGIFWCFSNISSYVIGAINLLFATLSHLTHVDRATMKTAIMILIVWLAFNWIYSAIFSKDIVNFVSLLLSDRDFTGFGTGAQLLSRKKKKTRITIESSDKIPDDIPHFMLKFSSTYFQNSNVTADIINKLKNKKVESARKKGALAKKIQQLKDFKDKVMVKRRVKPVNEIVKGENDHLNYSLCLEKYSKDTDPVATVSVAPAKNQSFSVEKLRKELNSKEMQKNIDSSKLGNILNDLSMDQGEKVASNNQVNTSMNNSLNQSVAQCLICYDQTPDSVLLECGHSGLCYECAVDIWKKTGECYLCRKPISKIVQLDIKAGVGKYMPVVKVSKMLKESFMADDSKIEEPEDILGAINGEREEDENQDEQNNQSVL